MKVTIIGGGSYQWTPELLADLLGTESLKGATIALEDIDPSPLPKMEALAGKLNASMEANAVIEATTDQRRALDGADFVIVTISTGGFGSMGVDLDVPARHGIRQSVGDSVGPGGVNRALRNIPVLVGIGKDMEAVCPDAWMLNITNPMTSLTRSVCKSTSIKTVGLCHEVGGWTIDLALSLGISGEAVKPKIAGVNHFPVIAALEVEGKDGFEVLREMIEEAGGLKRKDWSAVETEPFTRLDFVKRHVLSLTFLERFGAVAAAGDRHLAEFVPWALTEDSRWGAEYGIRLTTIADREKSQAEYIADVDAWLAGSKDLQTWQSGELPAPIIDSLLTGTAREVPVNIPNVGQCPDLPATAVVEGICVADGSGIRGRDEVRLPKPLAELVRRHVAVQEMTVEAALTGDRDLAAAAFGLDPLAGRGDWGTIDSMVEELLGGTASWLPQFAGTSV